MRDWVGDEIAHGALKLAFHEMLNAGQMPPVALRSYGVAALIMERSEAREPLELGGVECACDLRPAPQRRAGSHVWSEDWRDTVERNALA